MASSEVVAVIVRKISKQTQNPGSSAQIGSAFTENPRTKSVARGGEVQWGAARGVGVI